MYYCTFFFVPYDPPIVYLYSISSILYVQYIRPTLIPPSQSHHVLPLEKIHTEIVTAIKTAQLRQPF